MKLNIKKRAARKNIDKTSQKSFKFIKNNFKNNDLKNKVQLQHDNFKIEYNESRTSLLFALRNPKTFKRAHHHNYNGDDERVAKLTLKSIGASLVNLFKINVSQFE